MVVHNEYAQPLASKMVKIDFDIYIHLSAFLV